MRSFIAIVVVGFAAAPLPAQSDQIVPFKKLVDHASDYDGKVVVTEAQVCGTVVERPKWLFLTAKTPVTIVDAQKESPNGLTIVIPKDDKSRIMAGCKEGEFYHSKLTMTVKKDKSRWLGVVSNIVFDGGTTPAKTGNTTDTSKAPAIPTTTNKSPADQTTATADKNDEERPKDKGKKEKSTVGYLAETLEDWKTLLVAVTSLVAAGVAGKKALSGKDKSEKDKGEKGDKKSSKKDDPEPSADAPATE